VGVRKAEHDLRFKFYLPFPIHQTLWLKLCVHEFIQSLDNAQINGFEPIYYGLVRSPHIRTDDRSSTEAECHDPNTLKRFFYRKATSSPARVAKPRTYLPLSVAPPKTAFPAEAAVALATLIVDEAFAALVDEKATVVVAFAGFTEEEVVTMMAPEDTVDVAVVVLEALVVEDGTVTREDDVCFLNQYRVEGRV
jgi:hypothetical protein